MTGKAHFRVRGVTCGKCDRVHAWYKYRVWRQGAKIKEEYVGRCDQYGNMRFDRAGGTHRTQQDSSDRYTRPPVRPQRSPYEVLGIRYTATTAEINRAYRSLVKKYHPDINRQADPRIIVEINVAYHILTKY